jgi:hypothetical protein
VNGIATTPEEIQAIIEQIYVKPQATSVSTAVEPTVPVPEWEAPSHDEINLAETTAEELGLDIWDESDAKLANAIDVAHAKRQEASPQSVKLDFKTIALRSAARGENRVLPILVGGKNPLIKWKDSPIDTAPTEEWATLSEVWINELFKKYPDANACVVAKPNEFLFLDEDEMDRFRKGYEEFTGEPFPKTYTTSARTNRVQSHWRQTDASRMLGNIGQEGIIGSILSVRQNNLYVLAEGSQHKNGVDVYKVYDDSPVIPMPDKLVGYIQTLRKNKLGEFKAAVDASLAGPMIPNGEHDTTLFKIACKLRQIGLEEEGITSHLEEVAEKRCEGKGDDWREMCAAKASQACKYPPGTEATLILGKPADASEWREPAPFVSELAAVKPFDLNFLPASVQPWAKDVSERMSVPLDFVGIIALTTLAGVTNRRVFVHPKEFDKDWKEAISLSGSVVASSGKTKTPTWKVFTNMLVEIELDWAKDHAEKFAKVKAKYDHDLSDWEQQDKDTRGPKPEKPEPPPNRRLMLNDATPEAMHQIMGENPEGLFYYRDELSGWVKDLDKKGYEAARGIFLSAMNGNDPYGLDRIARGKVFAIMSASLFGGFQPELLVEFLNDTKNISDGTIPRFGLLVWPDDAEFQFVDRQVDETAKQAFRKLLRSLSEMKAESIGLHFSPDAQKRFNSWFIGHEGRVASEISRGKQSHLAKYTGLLPKLAGLFQIVDLVAQIPGSVPRGGHFIDVEHFDKALALLSYLETHMRRVYGCIKSPIQKAEAELAARLQAGDLSDGFSVRAIERKCWSQLTDRDTIGCALETFEELGWIRQLPVTASAGRPTIKWEINPKLTRKN